MVNLCQAIRCNACCFFPNDNVVEKNGFKISFEYDRPIKCDSIIAEKAFLAAKKYKVLNEEFPRERLSPCFLLDERGFCSGHSKYDKKNEEFTEIYRNGIKTEPDCDMEERCGGFTCDFFDEHHVFFRKNEKTLIPALERLDSQLEKMNFWF